VPDKARNADSREAVRHEISGVYHIKGLNNVPSVPGRIFGGKPGKRPLALFPENGCLSFPVWIYATRVHERPSAAAFLRGREGQLLRPERAFFDNTRTRFCAVGFVPPSLYTLQIGGERKYIVHVRIKGKAFL